MIPGLPNFSAWIERATNDWIKKGNVAIQYKNRIPVAGDPPVGWSVNNILTTGVATGQVQLQCSFTRQMQTHTVQFDGLDNSIAVAGGAIIRTQAEVLWSVQGNVVRRLVDVIDGASISGNAEAVTVNIRDLTTTAARVDYRVGCTVTPGLRANIQQPPLVRPSALRNDGVTSDVDINIAAGASASWTIPPNCGAVSSYVAAISTTPASPFLDSEILIAALTVNGATVMRYGASGLQRYVPLPFAAQRIAVANLSAQPMNVSCFIGIEG